MELLDCIIVLFLFFWGNFILFPVVWHQFTFLPTVYKSTLFSNFSPTLVNSFFFSFWITSVLTGMRWYLIMWFWFAFLWLVILSIFSCTLGYFYIFFGKLSIWIFSSCYNGINCSVSAEAATYFMKLFPISPVKKALPPLNQSSYLSLFPPAAAAAKLRQSCPTLCDPIDGSPPGSPIPGILQARTLEWVAISFSSARKWKWSRSVVPDS